MQERMRNCMYRIDLPLARARYAGSGPGGFSIDPIKPLKNDIIINEYEFTKKKPLHYTPTVQNSTPEVYQL